MPAPRHPQPSACGLLLRSLSVTNLRAGSWELHGAVNACWTLYRNDRDGAELRAGGAVVALAAGRLALIPPGVRYDASLRAPVRHLYGFFDLPGVPRLRLQGFERPWLAPASAGDALLGELAAREDPRPRLRESFALFQLIAAALAEHAPPQATVLDAGDRLAPALRLIDTASAQPLANADLARACGMSATHFARLFRAVTGTTPAQAVLMRRVRLAAQRLLDRDETLDEVAQACGLSTRPYLARVFRAHLGLSPGEYRRRHAGR
jgi:AraC-like DNA-binding protein